MQAISVKNLSVRLGKYNILKNISFDVKHGEVAAILGPNGSGKTTLLKTILGFIPYKGEISVLGESPERIKHIGSRIAYVPQRLNFDRTMPITVKELMGIHTVHKSKKHAYKALDTLGARHLYHKCLGELSGGEFQRVLLALALQNSPEILFLDEPTASIDVEGAGEVYELLSDVRKSDEMTIILVSHDIDVVFRYTDKVICLNHKIVCQGAPSEAITQKTIEELYGKQYTIFKHKV